MGVGLLKSFRVGVVVGLWSVAKWDATRREDTKDQRSKPAKPPQKTENTCAWSMATWAASNTESELNQKYIFPKPSAKRPRE